VSQLRYPTVRKIVQSSYIDIFAALLILGVSIAKDFHGTIYQDGAMQFGIPITELGAYVRNGAFPLGILSVIAAIFSVLATRLVGKQNNWGNFIGILTTISSGVLDYLFGNHSAYLGAYLFGGKTDHAFLITVSLGFGLSLGGNFCNAFKYEETWLSWVVYNIINLVKNAMQFNIANVAKYVFYLFNALITLFDWRFNGDAKRVV